MKCFLSTKLNFHPNFDSAIIDALLAAVAQASLVGAEAGLTGA